MQSCRLATLTERRSPAAIPRMRFFGRDHSSCSGSHSSLQWWETVFTAGLTGDGAGKWHRFGLDIGRSQTTHSVPAFSASLMDIFASFLPHSHLVISYTAKINTKLIRTYSGFTIMGITILTVSAT